MAKTLLDSILEKRLDWNGACAVSKSELNKDVCKYPEYYRKNGIMFKNANVSRVNYRLLSEYILSEHILSEYRRLRELNLIDSKHTAKPYAVVIDDFDDGSVRSIGYLMEFIDGMDLSDYLANPHIRSEKRDLSIISQLKTAVSKFHTNGLYHGDINERNVRITNDFNVKLIDPAIFYSLYMGVCIETDDRAVKALSKSLTQRSIKSQAYRFKEDFYGKRRQ